MSHEIKEEHEYHLLSKFKYADGGNQHEALLIKLLPPTSRNSRECAALKQAFFRAVDRGDAAAGGESGDSDLGDISGQDVIMTMAMSKNVDLPDVMDVAIKLFTSGVALVDGETKLTKHLVGDMSQDDLEGMLGEYLVNFTLASSLAQMKEKSSKGSQA